MEGARPSHAEPGCCSHPLFRTNHRSFPDSGFHLASYTGQLFHQQRYGNPHRRRVSFLHAPDRVGSSSRLLHNPSHPLQFRRLRIRLILQRPWKDSASRTIKEVRRSRAVRWDSAQRSRIASSSTQPSVTTATPQKSSSPGSGNSRRHFIFAIFYLYLGAPKY